MKMILCLIVCFNVFAHDRISRDFSLKDSDVHQFIERMTDSTERVKDYHNLAKAKEVVSKMKEDYELKCRYSASQSGDLKRITDALDDSSIPYEKNIEVKYTGTWPKCDRENCSRRKKKYYRELGCFYKVKILSDSDVFKYSLFAATYRLRTPGIWDGGSANRYNESVVKFCKHNNTVLYESNEYDVITSILVQEVSLGTSLPNESRPRFLTCSLVGISIDSI